VTTAARPEIPTGRVSDTLGRALRDLRISVTDRCNFRCGYCMPKETFGLDHAFLHSSSLLSFEEITRITRSFVAHGVEKIRLTGGEPLLRKHFERLVEMLAALRTADGRTLDLALTTNGSLLARKARALKDAGLDRVTVSLDSLSDDVFSRMNGVNASVSDVLEGVEAARHVGLGPIKVNMVVKRGINDHEVVRMARHFKGSGVIVRFIEYMDVGTRNGWKLEDVVPSAEVVLCIDQAMPLDPIVANYQGETATRWRYRDGDGEIGLISSVTGAFCGGCTRARLSAEGKLFTCLFATRGSDLRALLRDGCSDAEISTAISHIWHARSDRYSQSRTASHAAGGGAPGRLPHGADGRRVEMSYIGG
jgi:cyclic pyranopterin phosphate synthase